MAFRFIIKCANTILCHHLVIMIVKTLCTILRKSNLKIIIIIEAIYVGETFFFKYICNYFIE